MSEFETRLQEFKDAALDLSKAWEADGSKDVENYPDYLPSFDEFCYDVLALEVQ